jgi:hypothetical protein
MSRDSFQDTHPAYREGLRTAYGAMSRCGEIAAGEGAVILEATRGGARLMALVDPAGHVIQKVAHGEEASPAEEGLMDAFCGLLEGVTVQEASDHACIYLEDRLRDYSVEPPVTGVVTPENADPIFRLPIEIVRSLLEAYRDQTGYSDTENFFIHPPSDAWKYLSNDEKIHKLKEVFDDLPLEGAQPGGIVDVVEINDDFKVTVRFRAELESLKKQELLMKLERAAKANLDDTLQLSMEELKDSSVIRRL